MTPMWVSHLIRSIVNPLCCVRLHPGSFWPLPWDKGLPAFRLNSATAERSSVPADYRQKTGQGFRGGMQTCDMILKNVHSSFILGLTVFARIICRLRSNLAAILEETFSLFFPPGKLTKLTFINNVLKKTQLINIYLYEDHSTSLSFVVKSKEL